MANGCFHLSGQRFWCLNISLRALQKCMMIVIAVLLHYCYWFLGCRVKLCCVESWMIKSSCVSYLPIFIIHSVVHSSSQSVNNLFSRGLEIQKLCIPRIIFSLGNPIVSAYFVISGFCNLISGERHYADNTIVYNALYH